MKNIFLFFFFLCCGTIAQAQSGIGYVSEIESKARSILEKEKQIERLREQIQEYNIAKIEAKKNAEKRLEEAIARIENDAGWKNRLKTAQSGWEEYRDGSCSAGGPPPICVADHWFRSSVSKAMDRYNEHKRKFLKPYRDAVDEAHKPFEKKIDDTFDEIDKLKGDVIDLRNEIPPLTRKYHEAALKRADQVISVRVDPIMEMMASKHYHEDRVDYWDELSRKVREQMVEAEKEAEKNFINEINAKINDLEDRKKADQFRFDIFKRKIETQINYVKQSIANTRTNINTLKLQLQSANLVEEERQLLNGKLAEQERILALNIEFVKVEEQKIIDYRNLLMTKQSEYFKRLSDLRYDRIALVRSIKEKVRNNYQIRLNGIKQSRALSVESLNEVGKSITGKQDEAKREFLKWASYVEEDRVRILNACNLVGATNYAIYVRGDVVSKWSTAEGCVFQAESLKHGAGIVYTNCSRYVEVYERRYALLKGVQDNGVAVNKQYIRKTRFSLIYNKII